MSAARINIRNIDYFKYKKLVIDGNRDDYNASSKEVKSLCDSVQVSPRHTCHLGCAIKITNSWRS